MSERAGDGSCAPPEDRRRLRGTGRPLGSPSPGLVLMRAVRITGFGGPEVLDVVDLADPVPGDGQQLCEVSSSGVD